MTHSKTRFQFRPFLENLEKRLEPSSIQIEGGYGPWLSADDLVNLDQDGLESSSLAAGLTNDDLDFLALTEHRNGVPFLPAQDSIVHSLSPTPVCADFAESETGVAKPAEPVADTPPRTQVSQLSLSAWSSRAAGAATPVDLTHPAPLTLDAPRLVREAASNLPAAVQPIPGLEVSHTSPTAEVHRFLSRPVWASYLGGAGDDRLQGAALNPAPGANQPVVVTGFMQNANDPTEFDAVIATVSTDGTTATINTLGFGPGTRTEGHAVDVDSAGNLYVIGQTGPTSDPNTTTDLIARMDATGNVTWAVSLTPTSSTGVGSGIKLDAAGVHLFSTGAIDGNLSVAELTDLASTQPSVVYSSAFPVAAGSRVGTAIGSDSAGDADLAFTQSSGTDNHPGWAQVTPDGSSLVAGTYDSFGPKAGMFGITVDSSDNFYVTGAIGQGASPYTVLVVAKFDINVSPQYQVGWSVTDATGVRTADWIGRGIQVDDAGNAYMATVIDNGGGGNMALFEVGPTGRTGLDRQGNAFGAKDDQNRGLVLDTTNGVVYMVGFTNSPDFNLTASSFQPAYGGDPYDGMIIQDRLV